ncbi:unnamed protein product [Brachionus calyciflorus]|uniref:Vang-like protein n=1 Tax=Brachionus calyciflorus TaxID=104777 RepID=A0A814L371_9BILA|nr:unnamed protein product [Brachionus calyciflorus]
MMFGTVMMSNTIQPTTRQTNSNLLTTTASMNKYEASDTDISERTHSVYSTTRSRSRSNYYNRTNEPPLPSIPPPSHSIVQMNEPTYDKIKPEQDKIQVQILPMDDNWGETNTTAHTADFSDFNDDMTEDGRSSQFNYKIDSEVPIEKKGFFKNFLIFLKTYFGLICAFIVSFSSFLTPILFILIPKLNSQWMFNECGLECEGSLIGIAFKLFILVIGSWAIFLRRPKSPLPRIHELRAILVFLLSIITFSYWLFYYVRIYDTQLADFYKILQFTLSYLDVLLFVFIISVFVLELRHLEPRYVIRITRSPDGEEREYTLGSMSIQRAALWILEQYYKDFKIYNPWLEIARRKRAAQLMQIEKINRKGGDDNADAESLKSRKSSKNLRSSKYEANSGYNLSANDRLYEEYDFDKRLKRKKAKLLQVTEEAFNLIRRDFSMGENSDISENKKTLMDPYEAAQAVFSSIARDLRRFLRITKQQPYFTRESIVSHLANCISYDMTPKSFLQRYTEGEGLVFNDRAMLLNEQRLGTLNAKSKDQTWILISDLALYQSIENDIMFVLKQNEVSLMCTIRKLPRFNLIEDVLDPKRNKFVLKINSETTV